VIRSNGNPFPGEEVDATIVIVVGVPAKNYQQHAERLVKRLSHFGYRSKALAPQGIIDLADDIRKEQA
jgi:NifB/MoaA-like Fe-S oxidoreductase